MTTEFLEVEFELIICVIKHMYSDIAVLAPAGIPSTIRMEADGVNGTKMTLNPCKLLLKHQVEEACVKLSDPGRGGGDIHSLLPTSHNHMGVRVNQRRDSCRVDGSVGLVHLESLKVGDVPQARGGVLAGGDEHHAIMAELHVLDLLGVLLTHLNLGMKGYLGCGEMDGGGKLSNSVGMCRNKL